MIDNPAGLTGDGPGARSERICQSGAARAAARAADLTAGLRQFRVVVREYPFDPPVVAMLVRRGARRWVGVGPGLNLTARAHALAEILAGLRADPNLLFHLVEAPAR
ncbi:MAG: hypothetical protein QF719_03125 [Chloroflexota bacterium]|nr:hypothetical protein [Chloroflexota bacterium]MDP6508079.1 hypothetical protein [Chloroflexota bacterium]MDP6757194.1 hypothetical protein [Chloroflexota bacterium]